MGLDMYAYAANKTDAEAVDSNYTTQELAYWRKHPNLHGWMERLAKSKQVEYNTFNGVELELTYDDILLLEDDVKNGRLPSTTGFFFGTPADDYYLQQDLEFIKNAKAELFLGLRVFYNSSW